MSELHIRWRPKDGAESEFKVSAEQGAVLPSGQLPGAFTESFPLVLVDKQGWLVSLTRSAKFKLYSNGKELSVAEHAKAAAYSDKSSGQDIPVVRFTLGTAVDEARVLTPSGSLWFRVVADPKPVVSPSAAQTPAPAPLAGAAKTASPGAAPAASAAASAAAAAAAVAADGEAGHRDRAYWMILLLALIFHIGLMIILGGRDVPADMFTEVQQLPERFAKLIIPKEPEPVEEKAGGGDEAPQELPQEQPKEEETDAGDGGGKQDQPATSRSKDEIREAVRTKGILAVFAAKREGGGALSDVLSEGGIAAGLDQALGDVGGVVVAQRGMDVRGPRGAGGGKSADIGDLAAGSGRGVGLGSKATRKVEAGVQTASFVSQGSLSADAIRQVVQQNLRGIKFCYEKELAKNPELQGKVTVKFTIGPDGTLTNYEIESSTLNNAEAESCILQRMRRWRFPKPDKGSVTVSYPFIFTATG